MAWYVRSRPLSAEPPAESPSTRNNSDSSRSRLVQSNSLPGRPPPERMLLRSFNAFLALLAASRASAASATFLMIVCASLGFSSRILRQLLRHDAGDDPLDLEVVQPLLLLRVELRLRHLHADDDRQPLAEVLADRRDVLEQLLLGAVGVQRPRQGRAEAAQVRAADRS